MSAHKTIGQLFTEEPFQFGLRGDRYLWLALASHFSSVPLPALAVELEEEMEKAFLLLSGHPLSTPKDFHVEAFAHGGMSSGWVCAEFWQQRALPLLLSRHAKT